MGPKKGVGVMGCAKVNIFHHMKMKSHEHTCSLYLCKARYSPMHKWRSFDIESGRLPYFPEKSRTRESCISRRMQAMPSETRQNGFHQEKLPILNSENDLCRKWTSR